MHLRVEEQPSDSSVSPHGLVSDVTEDGVVCIEYPGGKRCTVRVPLELVPSYRSLVGQDWRRLPSLASQP
jgi:hypothetical protein